MDDTKQRIDGERRGEAADGFRYRTRAVEHDEQVRAVAGRVEERSLTHPGRRLRCPGPSCGQVKRLPGCDGRTLDQTAECIRALEPLDLANRGTVCTPRHVDEDVNWYRRGTAHVFWDRCASKKRASRASSSPYT